MKILLTGGSGLLGQELQKHMMVDAPSHNELDVVAPGRRGSYDLVIHSAAYTDVAKAEIDHKECFRVNFFGTFEMAKAFYDVPFVYISTEYAWNPTTYYGQTKLQGEFLVRTMCEKFLILRTLFKPNPFPFPKAFVDQHTQGDYCDVIAKMIVAKILDWDKKTSESAYIGTGRKTMFELAKRTRPDVEPCGVEDIKEYVIPKDYQ